MVATPANALNINAAGLVKFDGTSTFSGVTTTQHDLLIGAASNGITNVAPSATSGVPVISQGASSDPVFGTAVVAGGGTGAVTLTGVLTGNGTSAFTASAVTQYDVLVGGASNAVSSVGPGSAGQVLQSGGNAANPVYSTATYPATAGTSGNVITSNGTNFVSSSGSSLGSWVYLTTITASSSASIAFSSTYITSTYGTYVIVLTNIISANNNQALNMTYSTDNGATYLSTNYACTLQQNVAGSTAWFNSVSTTVQILQGANANNSGISGHVYLTGLRTSGYKYMTGFNAANNASNIQFAITAGWQTTSTAINNIKFAPDSGNLASGTIDLYGVIV